MIPTMNSRVKLSMGMRDYYGRVHRIKREGTIISGARTMPNGIAYYWCEIDPPVILALAVQEQEK